MKTLTEAATVVRELGFWERNIDLTAQVGSDPDILQLALAVSCAETPLASKLLQAMCLGIAIGIEMEKPWPPENTHEPQT